MNIVNIENTMPFVNMSHIRPRGLYSKLCSIWHN